MMNNNSRFYRTPWSNHSQPKKKVVSIPVHFVGSDSAMKIELRNNNSSAIKIQKVVRGFLVRNSMRRIKAIRVELEMIEEKVCVPETKELIGREQKERVKVSESIMNLLLKLDSVRVLDYYSGVRDYRKAVIKKAIALQEMVDQIQMVGPTHQGQPQLTRVEDADVERSSSARGSNLMKSGEDPDVDRKKMECLMDEKEEMLQLTRVDVERSYNARDSHLMKSGDGEDTDADRKKMEGLRDEKEEMEVEEKNKVKVEDGIGEESGFLLVRSGKDANAEGKKMEGLRDDEEEEEKKDGDSVGEESVGSSMVEKVEENCLVKEEVDEGCKDGIGDYENNKNKELLERMVEDNERMMDMMAQLFERNEMQTKLLSSLSQRVEQLERAYACDKLRRKKRSADAKHRQIH